MKPPHSHRPGGGGRPPSDRGPADRGPADRNSGRSGQGGPQRPSGGQGPYQGSGRGQGGGQGGSGRNQTPNRPALSGQGQIQPSRVYHSDAPPRDTSPRDTSPRDTSQRNARPHEPQADGRTLYARPPHAGAFRGPDQRANQRPDQQREDRSAPPTPRGAIWLYGYHAVAAALGNSARRLRRLILTEDAEATLATRRPQPWSIAPERMDRAGMDRLLGRDAVHQGVALLADPLAPPQLATVLARPGSILVLDQVTDPRNIGAILRSAAAFDVAGVITQDRNAPEETGAMAKAAAGAMEMVPLIRAVNISRTLIVLKAAGLWVVGLDASGPPLAGPSLAGRRIALVMGAESEGMRRLTRETCDEIAGLSMHGVMESLNVSAAAAIALYELSRRG